MLKLFKSTDPGAESKDCKMPVLVENSTVPVPGVKVLPVRNRRSPPTVVVPLPEIRAPELETVPREVRSLFPSFSVDPDPIIKLPTVTEAEMPVVVAAGITAVLDAPGTNPQSQLADVLKSLVPWLAKVQVAA
jgi:hypothetical protein